MDREFLLITTELGTKENGKMTSRTEQAQKHGQMGLAIQEGIMKERNMEKEC